MQLAMVEPADRDRVFVADFPVERAGLRKANVMGFGWHAAANKTGLRGDELAMLFVAQTNGLCSNAPAVGDSLFRSLRLMTFGGLGLIAGRFIAKIVGSLRPHSARRSRLNRGEPVAETRFDPVRVGGDQRVLGRKIGMDPICGLVGGLELAETGEQPLPQRR